MKLYAKVGSLHADSTPPNVHRRMFRKPRYLPATREQRSEITELI